MEDPDRDEVILNIFATEAKAVILSFEVKVTEFVASEMRKKTILYPKFRHNFRSQRQGISSGNAVESDHPTDTHTES